jgi:hypothetical protein
VTAKHGAWPALKFLKQRLNLWVANHFLYSQNNFLLVFGLPKQVKAGSVLNPRVRIQEPTDYFLHFANQ